MKATVYELSSNLHWYKVKEYEEVDNKLFQDLQAYVEYYIGQVRVDYSPNIEETAGSAVK